MVSYICLQMLIWTSIFDKLFANVKDAPFRFKLPIQTFPHFMVYYLSSDNLDC